MIPVAVRRVRFLMSKLMAEPAKARHCTRGARVPVLWVIVVAALCRAGCSVCGCGRRMPSGSVDKWPY